MMGFFSDTFGGGDQEQGYNADLGYIQQGMNQAANTLNPYVNAGMSDFNLYNQVLGGMTNPGQYINNLMQQFQMSPGEQFNIQQGQNAINAGAAASGLLGSGNLSESLANYTQGQAGQYMNDYISQALGLNSNLLNGLGQGAYIGGNSANALANMYGNAYDAMGQAAYGADTSQSNAFNNLLNQGTGMIGMYLGKPNITNNY